MKHKTIQNNAHHYQAYGLYNLPAARQGEKTILDHIKSFCSQGSRKKHSGIWLLIFLLMIVIASCTERIEIELDNTYTRLVVDGGITDKAGTHFVRLTTTTNYFFGEEPPAVSKAFVQLSDGDLTVTLTEQPGRKGYYATPGSFSGQPGKTYRLTIELPEKIGTTDRYQAIAEMPSTVFRLDSMQLEYNPRFDFWLVKVYAWDPPTTDFYKFDAMVNGKLLTDTASRASATPDRFFNGNNTNGFGVIFLYGNELSPGDSLTLVMSSISQDYFNFFSELRNETGFNNPLFGGPPANIRSNLNNGALGYFFATKTEAISMVVPADTGDGKTSK